MSKIEKAEWVGSTKKDLFDKYNELVEKLNSEEVTTTAQVVAKRETAATVASADSIVSDMDSVANTFNATMTAIRTMAEQYNQLNSAINTKRGELKDILGFEVEANSTIALVTAKEQMLSEKTEQADTIVRNARQTATDIISEAQAEATTMKQAQNRQNAEWEYEFERTKLRRQNELEDTLSLRIKDVDARVAAVKEREALADEKDARIAALEAKLAETEASIATRIETAVEEEKAKLEKSHAIAKSYMSKEHAAEIKIAEARAQNLTEKVSDLTSQLINANSMIAAANTSVADMAKSALTAKGDAATIARVAEVAAGASSKR